MNRFLNHTFTLLTVCGMCFAAITTTLAAASTVPLPDTGSVDSVRSVSVFFRVNESVIDRSFLDNEQNLAQLKNLIDTGSSGEIAGIRIEAHSSPEGSPAINRALSKKRAETIYRLLLDINPRLDRSTIVSSTVEDDWISLKSRIEAQSSLADREPILRIIGDPDRSQAAVERNLRAISDGAAFRELDSKILKYTRVGIITVTTRHAVHRIPIEEISEEPLQETTVVEVAVPQPEAAEETVTAETIAQEPFTGTLARPAATEYLVTCPVALKTNLLFLAVGGLNAAVEVPLGGRFSVSAGFAYAHTRIDNRYAVQTLQGGFEAKYWFNPHKRVLSGWNLGLYGLYSSRFDVQWQDGWQGDGFVSMGIAGGYSLPIGRSLNLEFAAAAGAFHSPEIRKYSRPQYGHLMWEETRQNVWRFLPAKLQINLVWLIHSKTRVVER